MLFYLDFFFPVLFWVCSLYALRTCLIAPDQKKKHVFLVFFFASLAFTFSSPFVALSINRFLGFSSVSRLIEDISCLLALYFGYVFFTDFAFETKKTIPLLTLWLSFIIVLLVFIFLVFLSRPELENAFLVDNSKNIHIFIYNIVFESFFLPLFIICGINFQRYARAIKERLAAFRLYVFSLGSFIGALSRIVKLIYLFQLRYLTFLTPLNFPVMIRVLNLFLVLFFFGGFVMPAFLKRTVEFFDELLMLRRIHYNLVSLLALINDVCSLLPINKDMAYYVTKLCQKFSLSLAETEQTVESACIYAVLTNKTRLAKENPSGKDSYVSRTTVKQAAAAFAEEIKFYDGVYKQIQYAKERCDTQNLSSEISRDMIPIGARIIKVVGDFLNKSSSVKEGIMLLREGAGKEFDSEVVEAFIEILQEEKVIVG